MFSAHRVAVVGGQRREQRSGGGSAPERVVSRDERHLQLLHQRFEGGAHRVHHHESSMPPALQGLEAHDGPGVAEQLDAPPQRVGVAGCHRWGAGGMLMRLCHKSAAHAISGEATPGCPVDVRVGGDEMCAEKCFGAQRAAWVRTRTCTYSSTRSTGELKVHVHTYVHVY
jgi:hypothetical protein